MKVSICTITYNHEKYIQQALDSFLMQQTNFPFEIVISDDYSTDGTRDILKRYQAKYPEQIRILLQPENIGMIPNFKAAIDACKGDYVALCEGDDYWIDINKLTKQVAILDSNPSFAICFHKAKLLFDGIPPFDFPDINEKTKKVSTIFDLINGNFMHTPTVMYRNYLFGKYPENFLKYKFGDWPLHLLNAEKGDIYFLPEELAVYRISSSGAWSSKSIISKIEYTIKFLSEIQLDFDKKYHAAFNDSIKKYYQYLIKLKFKNKEFISSIKFGILYLKRILIPA